MNIKFRLRPLIVLALFLLVPLISSATPSTAAAPRLLAYVDGETKLLGETYLPTPRTPSTKLPAIVVFHDWMGITDVTRAAALEIVGQGYVTVLADMYGEGVRPTTVPEAGALSGQWKKDRPALRKRALAAIAAVSALPEVDATRVVVIGYCFGGTVALEAGRAGAPIRGIVSIHGGLETPDSSLAKNIRAKVLALHGADDPFVPAAEVAAFEAEMRAAQVDWQLIAYGGAVHAFTNKQVDALKLPGAAYNDIVAKRAFLAMTGFFKEVVGS